MVTARCATICGPSPGSGAPHSKHRKCRGGNAGRTTGMGFQSCTNFRKCWNTHNPIRLRRRPPCNRSTPAIGCIAGSPCHDQPTVCISRAAGRKGRRSAQRVLNSIHNWSGWPLWSQFGRTRPIEPEARRSLWAHGRCMRSRHCGTRSSHPQPHLAEAKRSTALRARGEMGASQDTNGPLRRQCSTLATTAAAPRSKGHPLQRELRPARL
mmetsp:Transcript_112157/g.281076  ORF Transcript_112157/g.281076 Transcript_112157/m.281076 type:complete len:210 (+) Transcript_112157:96-725(+)